ncbi:MAG: TolC family protein [Gemmataceae bacterium]
MERINWTPIVLTVLLLPFLKSAPCRAQAPAQLPMAQPPSTVSPTLEIPGSTRGDAEQTIPQPRSTTVPRDSTLSVDRDQGGSSARPSQKSPLELPAPNDGEVLDLKPPPLEPGDLRFPINLATALRLADSRPINVAIAQASAWASEADLQKAKVLWIPSLNVGFDYIRHDGYGPDLNRGINIPTGENALGQNAPGSFGKPLNNNINLFYGGAGMTFSPSTPNYFYQPTPDVPLLPSPQMQFLTDIIFEPLHAKQNLNAARWDIQGAKNDALYMTASAYFNVHRYRGMYAVSIDVVQRGRRLVADIDALRRDLVPSVEVDRARNLLADLEQHAVSARQYWRVASANLTRILRLDPRAVVEPLESDHLQITLIDPSRSLDDLIPIGLTNRPELAKHQALVQATLVAIRREKLRPLLPSVLINGFQTPYELFQAMGYGEGSGGKLNLWSFRDDVSPQVLWTAGHMGMGNLADIKAQRAMASQQIVQLFQVQDSVAADVTRAQADLQSAAARVVQAEREVRGALVNYNGNVEGLRQTKRFGNVLQQIFRPQEVVFALQLLMTAYDNYITTVAEYNTAQFELFHALGYPAREIAFLRQPGAVVPVNTERPSYLPPVGAGPPPASR